MTQKDYTAYIQDIFDAINDIEEFIHNMKYAEEAFLCR